VTIRWSKECHRTLRCLFDNSPGPAHILYSLARGQEEVIAVLMTVNRYLMPTGDNLSQSAGGTLYLFSNDKESSPCVGSVQQLEKRIQLIAWPIIKSQSYCIACPEPSSYW
jgi:hypothetical protein